MKYFNSTGRLWKTLKSNFIITFLLELHLLKHASQMVVNNNSDLKKITNLLAMYNMMPNLLWSVLNLVPISIFCFTLMEQKIVYIFLAVSCAPIFFKNTFLDRIQIGKQIGVYKKLGVHFINKVAQNGSIINSLIKKKYPGYKAVINKRSSIAKLIRQTYVFEKFHWILFIFFSQVIVYALWQKQLTWGLIILLNNILYNVYPNLLQQYIRLKLRLFGGKVNKN